jgi:hypothetical protein
MVLLVFAAREMAERGIHRVDLGKGQMRYKSSLKSGDLVVAEGVVDRRAWAALVWHQWLKLRDRVRCSPLRTSAHRIDRWLTRSRLWLGMDR